MQKLQQQAASNSKEADAARAQAVLTQQQLVSLQEERGKLAAAESAQIKELEALRAKEKARESERARLDEHSFGEIDVTQGSTDVRVLAHRPPY